MNYQQIIQDIHLEISNQENKGNVASYIPELAKVNPNQFGVCMKTIDGLEYATGACDVKFSIQSISKVLSLSLAYKILGDSIWDRVGVEPSGNPFNSLIQLETDNGIPRNPFINAGALVICDILITHLEKAKEEFLHFVRDISSNKNIYYSPTVVQSEKSIGYRNVALCNFIKSFGNIKNDPDEVLDFYFHICSIELSCRELTSTFGFLTNHKLTTASGKNILTKSQAKRINAIMLTCGFYDESGEFSFEVGLPGKSGVGGGIIALYPNTYCIAVWSPKLNEKGNSNRGMAFLESFTTETELSIF